MYFEKVSTSSNQVFYSFLYLFKVINSNTRKRWEICSKFEICSFWWFYCEIWIFIVDFEQVNVNVSWEWRVEFIEIRRGPKHKKKYNKKYSEQVENRYKSLQKLNTCVQEFSNVYAYAFILVTFLGTILWVKSCLKNNKTTKWTLAQVIEQLTCPVYFLCYSYEISLKSTKDIQLLGKPR